MKKSLKPCREVNCGNLTRNTWCDKHRNKAQEKSRDYNRYNRDDKTNGFYQSAQWRRVRSLALQRDNHLCKRCLREGKLQQAQLVHHIIEVKVDWSKRLELNNLESICHACHNKHHKS